MVTTQKKRAAVHYNQASPNAHMYIDKQPAEYASHSRLVHVFEIGDFDYKGALFSNIVMPLKAQQI